MKLVASAVAVVALLVPPVVATPAAAPRVVSVTVGRADAAKGFVAAPGRVVTVAHVLGPGEVTVDGRAATILHRDARLDVAVLSVPGITGPQARFVTGSEAAMVGGRAVTVIRHVRARIDGSTWKRPVIELRARVHNGDSGLPVVTSGGRVAGVVFARSTARDGTAWAVDGLPMAVALSGWL